MKIINLPNSGRFSWDFYNIGPLKTLASVEGGIARISNLDTVTANGSTAGMTLGLEYPFAKHFRISLDAGHMWYSANSSQASFSAVDIVYNTALYYYLF
jgi:hypothetical protein